MSRKINLGKVRGKDYVLTEADRLEIAQKIVPNATAEAVSLIDAYYGYEGENDILGLQVDYENKTFTRLAGAIGLSAGTDFDKFPMYGGMKRCNIKSNGEITAYYGEGGYADDNTATQTMVEMPKFYYKVVPLKLEKIEDGPGYHIRKANYYITDKQYPGFKLHPAFINEQGDEIDKFYYSAYEGYLTENGNYYNDATHMETTAKTVDPKIHTISSRANRKPISGQNFKLYRSSEEQCIAKLGSGWHLETMKAHSAIQFLMMIEYGKLNMQPTSSTDKSAFAYGVCNTTAPYESVNRCATTGATASLGNKTGVAASTSFEYYDVTTKTKKTEIRTDWQSSSCSYRGIEN
ncbi:MAG: hypothetical protein K2G56_03880, partial [Eubacterium sp.]|nr:hypothetical protein [Eubacterium sp.]